MVHKHCAFASFHAIIGGLAEVVGYPYDTVPTQVMEWASGGVAGFSTFCGALNGACAAIGLICSNTDAVGFISDLLFVPLRKFIKRQRITPKAVGSFHHGAIVFRPHGGMQAI